MVKSSFTSMYNFRSSFLDLDLSVVFIASLGGDASRDPTDGQEHNQLSQCLADIGSEIVTTQSLAMKQGSFIPRMQESPISTI